jgi:hypothetical protein
MQLTIANELPARGVSMLNGGTLFDMLVTCSACNVLFLLCSPILPTHTAPLALHSSPAVAKWLLAATSSLLRTTPACLPCSQLWWEALLAAACQLMIR